MKLTTTIACLSLIAPLNSKGATLLTYEVFLTLADGRGGVPAYAENITAPTRAWYMDDLRHREGEGIFGAQGLGGGRVTIYTEPGETVESARIQSNHIWDLVFDSYGPTTDTQIWVSQNPLNGTRGSGWIPLSFGGGFKAQINFQVQTSMGLYGESFTVTSTVPEPTSGLLLVLSTSIIFILKRRR